MLQMNIVSVHNLAHKELRINKVCTHEMKQMCLAICSTLLACYEGEDDNFLEQIITGNKSRVHHLQPETK